MEQRFSLEQGSILCQEQRDHVEVIAHWNNDGRGLYKGYLQGEHGQLELGALLPEGNQLNLRRSISIAKLKQVGCWPITGGQLVLVHSFGGTGLPTGWRKEENPARLFAHDVILRNAAEQLGRCLLCQSEAGFGLAIPYHQNKPFEMLPVFCFARLEQLNGTWYVVFRFHPDASPRWPPKRS